MATIKEVAAAAGVSISTVSNVLNNRVSVGECTYQAVMEAAKALNYRPNLMARSLKKTNMNFLGIILPALTGIYKDIISGIQSELQDKNYYVVVDTTDGYESKERSAISRMIDIGVSGIFLVTCAESWETHAEIFEANIPLVYVERCFEGYEHLSVVFDNRSMTRKLFLNEYKKGLKTEEVLLITGKKAFSSERDCVDGALEAIARHGDKPEALNWIQVTLNEVQAFGELLEQYQSGSISCAKTIIISNDCLMDALLEVLHTYNRRDVTIFVPRGDCWNVNRTEDMVKYIPRKAISCGKNSAQLMKKQLRSPVLYDGVQSVLSTDLVNEYPLLWHESGPKLRLLLSAGPIASAIEKISPQYKTYANVQVECKTFFFQQDLFSYIRQAEQRKDDAFDIYMIDLPWLDSLSKEGCLMPLTDWQKDSTDYIESFTEGIWNKFVDKEGRVFGIPLSNMTQMMVYRKDMFNDQSLQRLYYKKYGLPLTLPQNWAEFNFVSKFFTKAFNDESPTEYGTCLVGQSSTGLMQEFLPRQWSQNGRIMEKGHLCIDSVQNARALEILKKSYECSIPNIWDYMENEQIGEFSKGRVAMINTYNGHLLSMFNQQFAGISYDIGFSNIPGKYSLMGGWLLGINAQSKKAEIAYDFIRWLTSDSISLKCSLLGAFVPKRIVAENEQIRKVFPWSRQVEFNAESDRTREIIWNHRGQVVHNNIVDDVLAEGVRKVLYQNVPVKTALAEVKASIDKYLL